jgi:hypothetical protein
MNRYFLIQGISVDFKGTDIMNDLKSATSLFANYSLLSRIVRLDFIPAQLIRLVSKGEGQLFLSDHR